MSDNQKNMKLTTNLKTLSSANHDFSFSLYKEVAKTEKGNILFSPFSIHLIMFMASTGATSKTLDEMVATMHLDEITRSQEAYRNLIINVTSANKNINLATGIFVDTDFTVKDSFVINAMKYLKSTVSKLSLKETPELQRQALNNWVSSKTNNKVKDLFSEGSITEETKLVLVNALHFKSEWEKQFKYVNDDFFYVTSSNRVSVKMMENSYFFQYYHDKVLKFKTLELPYKYRNFKMIILLPDDKEGLKDLENNFSKINLHDISKKMTRKYVEVKLPRFKTEKSLQLQDTLSNLGCPTMFTPDANFSNIIENGDLFVNSFLHKAYIDVDEYGTEAKAFTGELSGGGYIKPTEFHADHPFVFFISTRCNFIIFVGRMTKID